MQEAHLVFNPDQKLKTSHPFQVQNKPSIWNRLQESTLEKNRNFLKEHCQMILSSGGVILGTRIRQLMCSSLHTNWAQMWHHEILED
jgi:hypothetical protein